MSGERILAFLGKPKMSPLEERLDVESDRRLFGSMGSGSVLGIGSFLFVLSIDPGVIPYQIWDGPGPQDPIPLPRTRVIIPDEAYHGPIRKPKPSKVRPGQPGHKVAKPQTPHPSEDIGVLAARVITSKRGNSNLTAYDLIGNSLNKVDLDKLTDFGVLKRTDASRIAGRRGMVGTENTGYYLEGTGGKEGGIPMPGMTDGPIVTRVRNPSGIGKSVEIDKFENTTTRSTASILAVIRSHSPGLRHIYNTFLKARPGLAGKITLRFAIAPSGQVVDVGLAGSTTSAPDFDAQVVSKVMAWRFEPVKAIGNDIVTVPFNFSE
ncbi:MAG: TonB family protein [Fibrobacteres bacterium]|nr:TonB family protein [Fibrobacterota bacterium]